MMRTVIGDLVVAGVAGADDGIRGFLAAYQATIGQLAWRFWTAPRLGEPGWETWQGNAVEFGGGSTWLTGSYDPEIHLLYWPTGNPFPDTDGSHRKGDNLYTNCIVALDPDTGKLRCHFQFTPHDLYDWDAVQPAVLLDAQFQGRPRKFQLHADRNGFYYVLDRTNGELLLAKPFARKISWASGIGAKGRPIELPGMVPDGDLFSVPGGDPPRRYLRAIEIETGIVAWEIEQKVPTPNYGGVPSTAGGVVFYSESSGGFAAVDAKTGRPLWKVETSQPPKASPMTHMIPGRQYVAVRFGIERARICLT